MKLFSISLINLVMLLCIKNAMAKEKYIEIALYTFIMIMVTSLHIYSEKKDVIQSHIKKFKVLLKFLVSPIAVLAITIHYNNFTSILYHDYFRITEIRNPLFTLNATVPNIIIYLSTLILIYGVFLLYFLYSVTLILFIHDIIKIKEKSVKILPIIILFCALLYVIAYMGNQYKREETINLLIKNTLYEYQYYENEINENKYICNKLKDKKNVKIYPLYSENKVSYVMKNYDKTYTFDITECN